MSVLLDTHVWIWSQESPDDIGPESTAVLENLDRPIFVSTVSSLEISRLRSSATVTLSGSLMSWIRDTLEALGSGTIPVSHEITVAAYELPGDFHRDPADRLLVATARLHDLELITADDRILGYDGVRSRNARH